MYYHEGHVLSRSGSSRLYIATPAEKLIAALLLRSSSRLYMAAYSDLV
jgi:hypothetical protein